MTDYRTMLERDLDRVGRAPFSFDDVAGRLDRKRRTQRITAAIVGIAVFVAAVWIVRDVVWLDRTQTLVPGASGPTGPTETRPPTVTSGPEDGFAWPPPQGVEPSMPASEDPVAAKGGIHPWWYVQVFADGRVIWLNENTILEGWQERRLTPEGVDLVRSGTVELGGQRAAPGQALAASAWEEAEWRLYIPARYVACTGRETIPLLPQEAQDLLRDFTSELAIERGEVDYSAGGQGATCPEMTIEEFRTLDEILLQGGWNAIEGGGILVYEYADLDTHPGFVGGIEVIGLLPDGTFTECCPG